MKKYTVIGVLEVDPTQTFSHHMESENAHEAEISLREAMQPAVLLVAAVLEGHVTPTDTTGTGPGSVTPLRRKANKPVSNLRKFRISYDVRYHNGSIDVEALDEDDARRQFELIPQEILVEHTSSVAAEVEEVEIVQKGVA